VTRYLNRVMRLLFELGKCLSTETLTKYVVTKEVKRIAKKGEQSVSENRLYTEKNEEKDESGRMGKRKKEGEDLWKKAVN